MAFAPPRKPIKLPTPRSAAIRARPSPGSLSRSPSCPDIPTTSARERGGTPGKSSGNVRGRTNLFTSTPNERGRGGNRNGLSPATNGPRRTSSLERLNSGDSGSSFKFTRPQIRQNLLDPKVRTSTNGTTDPTTSSAKSKGLLKNKVTLTKRFAENADPNKEEEEKIRQELDMARLEYSSAEIKHILLQETLNHNSDQMSSKTIKDLKDMGLIAKRKEVLMQTMQLKRIYQQRKLEELDHLEKILTNVKENICSPEAMKNLEEMEARVAKSQDFLPIKNIQFKPNQGQVLDDFRKLLQKMSLEEGNVESKNKFTNILNSAKMSGQEEALKSKNELLNDYMDKLIELESLKCSMKALPKS